MTATNAKFAVYVSDDNGWNEGCPDYRGVFFGTDIPKGGKYVGPQDSDLGGHVEFDNEADAECLMEDLDSSGDWVVSAPGHEHEGEERRPSYAIKEIDAE